ncbi:MAG: DUF1636 domain-containing protein [Pseudomonadota bacterium]
MKKSESEANLDAPTLTGIHADGRRACTLHVCTSCRPRGAPREPREQRPGFILYHRLREALNRSEIRQSVQIQPADCLSLCPRPCGITLSCSGRWTYLFGDQEPGKSVEDILECVSAYLDSADGMLARTERPRSLRASIRGRIPPMGPSPC